MAIILGGIGGTLGDGVEKSDHEMIKEHGSPPSEPWPTLARDPLPCGLKGEGGFGFSLHSPPPD